MTNPSSEGAWTMGQVVDGEEGVGTGMGRAPTVSAVIFLPSQNPFLFTWISNITQRVCRPR